MVRSFPRKPIHADRQLRGSQEDLPGDKTNVQHSGGVGEGRLAQPV
jgi:hypothetical protein